MGYKTVEGDAKASFTEKKSEFIGYVRHTATEREALDFIAEIRSMHRKARHNCYAYILRENNISRHSDDGEPSGTAGAPIYDVLSHEGLCDVSVVVTRYFGGILLGTGGLVRAYTKAAQDAVKNAVILDIETAVRLSLSLEYSCYGRIGRIITEFDARTENEEFGAGVDVTLYVREENVRALEVKLTDACDGKIIIKNEGVFEYNFG